MKRHALLTGLAIVLTAGPASAQDEAALATEGKALIQRFSADLKSELLAAIEAGGPVNAIGVCHMRAPEIASDLSSTSGWSVARSSHRLRNPDNAPDPYTEAVIEDFLAREAEGEQAADLTRAEIVEEDGRQAFRMVKAIPTGELCLTCHGGEDVPADVEAKLADLYPADKARGFALGQMRGVFTLRKPID